MTPEELEKKLAEQMKLVKELQDGNKTLQSKLDEHQRLSDEQHENELKEQNRWKELYEQAQDVVKEKDAKLNDLREKGMRNLRMNAFKSNLGGELLNEKYMDLVNLNDIKFVDGKIDKSSLDSVIESFKTDHGVLIKTVQEPLPEDHQGELPDTNSGSNPNALTKAEWEQLPIHEKIHRIDDIIEE